MCICRVRFCVNKTKTQICFEDIRKRLYLELLLFLGFFCVLTNQICFANIYYFCNTKNRCKILYRPTLTTKLDDILSYIAAFSFVTIVRWQKTSVLANQRSPTLTTSKCKYIVQNIIKVAFCIRTRTNYDQDPFFFDAFVFAECVFV